MSNNSQLKTALQMREDADGVVVAVFAKPRASRTRILGVENGALSVALAAPPADGAANEELIRALSHYFGLPKRQVTITTGSASRHKKVLLRGLRITDVLAKAPAEG